MPEIQPFRGVRYSDAADLTRVLAPPYDVIPPARRDALYARDPHNIVRVVLNRTPGDAGYAEAGETLKGWIADGTLRREKTPSLYLLEQGFEASGKAHQRVGLLARFRAEDPERRIILPHEQTRKAAKEDRWRVLQTTRANFSPIMLMFPDPGGRFSTLAADTLQQPALVRFDDDDGVGHRLWRIDDPGRIAEWHDLFDGSKAYIADGHHRHATALRWRDETGPEGAWTLGYLTPMEAPGLLVLPYHRILSEGPSLDEAARRLDEHFRLTRVGDASASASAVTESKARWAFALAESGGGGLVAESKDTAESLLPANVPSSLSALDTYFLHHAVLGPLLGVPDAAVSYVHSQSEAEEAVARGRCRLAVFLRGMPVRQIVDVSEAGESMPAKSTFFHPKLPSGLVIHPLVGAEG
ncbi:MAG: DUF1015 domain-containing protein [Acidobacteriota bacterium]